MKKRWSWGKGLILILLVAGIACAGGYGWVFYDLPALENIELYVTTLAPSMPYAAVELDEVPAALVWSVLAAEEPTFYQTPEKVEVVAVVRAVWSTLRCYPDKCLWAGRTITQQLAQSLTVLQGKCRETTLRCAMRELGLVFRLRHRYSHQEILAGYLNVQAYPHSIYGVGGAARYYLGKPVQELSLAESAVLQACRGIETLDSGEDYARLWQRQGVILDRLVEQGFIEANAAQAAKAAEVSIVP